LGERRCHYVRGLAPLTNGRLMETWRGHFPITSFVLLAMSHKVQDPALGALSHDEQVLFDACEFWAAMADRSLTTYFGNDPAARLLAAQQAFTVVGAVRVASALRVGFRDLTRGPKTRAAERVALELEEKLLTTEDNVEQLISAYASERLLAGLTSG
jgi:hypothetical protein